MNMLVIKNGRDIIKKKNIILSLMFSLLTMLITFYIIFRKHNINSIMNSLMNVNPIYVLISLILVALYFICQGVYTKLIFKSLGRKYKVLKGSYYGMIEYLFSGITPSSSGGQPMVIYYMKKEKIPVKQSTMVMLVNTIFFKLFLVVGGIFILIFKPDYVFNTNSLITIFFFLGLGLDLFLTVFYSLFFYKQKLIRVIFMVTYKLYYKITNKNKDYKKRVNEILEQYNNEKMVILTHKKDVFKALLVTFLQRIFMCSVLYVIARGLGFNSISYFNMLLLQIFVQISIEAIFLPGGTGISEYVSSNMFILVFGALSTTGMLLFRLLTFYIPILFIAILYVFMVIFKYKKHKN